MMTEKDLTARCVEICKSAGYDFTIPVKINKRLTRTLGRVLFFSCGGYTTPESMEFSYKLLEVGDPATIDNVIKHECAHYLVIVETHENHGHDKVFKEMCARINCTFDATKTKVAAYSPDTYKYIVTCSSCGEIVGRYHRAGKVVQHPNYYTCKCGGRLTVTQNW